MNTILPYLIILPTPENLPGNHRYITSGKSATLIDAVALISRQYPNDHICWDVVYYTLSDGKYWFVLQNKVRGKT